MGNKANIIIIRKDLILTIFNITYICINYKFEYKVSTNVHFNNLVIFSVAEFFPLKGG